MQIIHHLTIDLARQLPVPPIGAVQNDANTRAVEVSLLENGTAWEVPDGVTAAVAFRKPDGHKGLYDTLPDGTKAVTIDGSTVTAILASQVLSCAGEVSAAVVFHDGNLNQLATFPFTIRVKANPAAGQALSNDYYRYSTMEEVNEAVEAALASMEESKQDFLTKAEEALAVVHDTATEDAPAIVCEASGTVISMADASNRPLQGLSIYGKTTQNGTPTPSAPVPLESAGASGSIGVTVAGKNLFDDIGWFESNGFTKQSDGSWLGVIMAKPCFTNPTKQKGAMYITSTYRSSITTGVPLYIIVYYTDGTMCHAVKALASEDFITTACKTDPEKTIDYIKWSYGGAGVYYVKDVMFSFVDNEYEPYKSLQTLTASTPNGLHSIGEVKDEIDFARGVRITRVAEVDMGTLDWSYSSAYGIFSSSVLTQRSPVHADGLCTHYPVAKKYFEILADKELVVREPGWSGNPVLVVTDSSYTDGAAFKAAMAGAIVLYELETPIETPLSAEELAQYAALHSTKPNTTVFNDGGAGMKLSYNADTKLYIDQKLAAISAAMLNA